MVDSYFGHWFAGFVDGEGCFYIADLGASRPGVLRPRFSLTLRCDDRPLIDRLRNEINVGTIHEYEPAGPGKRVVRFVVQSQSDCEILVALFTAHPLRSKKARDFAIWAKAVKTASKITKGPNKERNSAHYAKLRGYKEELKAVRAYR